MGSGSCPEHMRQDGGDNGALLTEPPASAADGATFLSAASLHVSCTEEQKAADQQALTLTAVASRASQHVLWGAQGDGDPNTRAAGGCLGERKKEELPAATGWLDASSAGLPLRLTAWCAGQVPLHMLTSWQWAQCYPSRTQPNSTFADNFRWWNFVSHARVELALQCCKQPA